METPAGYICTVVLVLQGLTLVVQLGMAAVLVIFPNLTFFSCPFIDNCYSNFHVNATFNQCLSKG